MPKPDDTLVIGLSDAVPRCAVRLRMHCTIEGVGVDPDETRRSSGRRGTARSGTKCDVDDDATGGLNRDGDVVIHVGREHVAAVLDGVRGGWIRARVTAAIEGQPTYTASPQIHTVEAATVGGSVDGVNAEIVSEEVLGISDGTAGQRFPVRRAPVLAGAGEPVLECSTDEGWTPWTEVQDFTTAGADDPVFVLDAAAGEVVLGPAVRQPDGSIRMYGRVPAKGEQLRLRSYATGGGRGGNVSRGAISVLKSRRSRTSRGSRTEQRREAASTARISRTPSSAARSSSGRGRAPSRPRTSSSSRVRPRRRWVGFAVSPPVRVSKQGRCGSSSCRPLRMSEAGCGSSNSSRARRPLQAIAASLSRKRAGWWERVCSSNRPSIRG